MWFPPRGHGFPLLCKKRTFSGGKVAVPTADAFAIALFPYY